jgi:hypothetical protein
MTDTIDILSVLSDDKTTVAYRPALARILDSALAAVLLQQIIYWWKQKDRLPFFKFKQPCKHKAYHGGDSWCEELALSRSEFDNALGVIGTKIKRGMTRESALAYKMPEEKDFIGFESGFKSALKVAFKHLILYWTDGSRITWYMINEVILKQILALAYGPKAESSFTYVKQNPALPYKAESSFTYLTETTQRLHREEEKNLADQKTSADLKADPTPNLVAPKTEPEPKPESQPDSVSLFQAALEPKEKGSGEKEKVYVPPAGYEQRYVSRRLDQESWVHAAHLVSVDTADPHAKCKRCGESIGDGTQINPPTPGITFIRCAGKEPKPRQARDAPVTYTAEVKNALAQLCKKDWTIQANASSMGRALKQLDGKINVAMLDRFKVNWYKCDFRGLKGQAPKPNQVVDEWTELTESDECKDFKKATRRRLVRLRL